MTTGTCASDSSTEIGTARDRTLCIIVKVLQRMNCGWRPFLGFQKKRHHDHDVLAPVRCSRQVDVTYVTELRRRDAQAEAEAEAEAGRQAATVRLRFLGSEIASCFVAQLFGGFSVGAALHASFCLLLSRWRLFAMPGRESPEDGALKTLQGGVRGCIIEHLLRSRRVVEPVTDKLDRMASTVWFCCCRYDVFRLQLLLPPPPAEGETAGPGSLGFIPKPSINERACEPPSFGAMVHQLRMFVRTELWCAEPASKIHVHPPEGKFWSKGAWKELMGKTNRDPRTCSGALRLLPTASRRDSNDIAGACLNRESSYFNCRRRNMNCDTTTLIG